MLRSHLGRLLGGARPCRARPLGLVLRDGFSQRALAAATELDVLPSHRSAPRKNRRGGSELTPILSAQDGEPAADLIESAQPEDLIEEETTAPSSEEGPLAKRMWRCALRGVRAEEVWARFAQQVLMTGAMRGAKDVSLMFRAFAKIKYRDRRALDALSPFILRHIDAFDAHELALILNAHKRLEYERTDSIHLLVSIICQRKEEWTGLILALTCNAVAHFHIYRPRFWRQASMSLMRLVWTMSPLELFLVVSAMARVDRRDEQSLRMLAKMCHRCAQRNLFNQETLATLLNAFAKLDYNHAKLSKSLEDAVLVKLDRALELGPKYRASRYLQELDVFDVQALVLLFRSLIVLVGTTDEVAEKMLTLLQWSKDEMSDYQKRVLKPSSLAFRHLHPQAWRKLSRENREALHVFQNAQVDVKTFESRWMAEVRRTLRKMDIKTELKPLVDDQVLDIWLPVSKAVVCPIGPYGYYAGTTQRTAYSKMHQKVLELEGHVCIPVPYFEWAELKTDEDKMVYLWSLGRKAASKDQTMQVSSETEPAEVESWQSDTTDAGHEL